MLCSSAWSVMWLYASVTSFPVCILRAGGVTKEADDNSLVLTLALLDVDKSAAAVAAAGVCSAWLKRSSSSCLFCCSVVVKLALLLAPLDDVIAVAAPPSVTSCSELAVAGL